MGASALILTAYELLVKERLEVKARIQASWERVLVQAAKAVGDREYRSSRRKGQRHVHSPLRSLDAHSY